MRADQSVPGQFDLDRDRQLVVALNGDWRFHTGDDLQWADPTLDDSTWPLISTKKTWAEQGYQNLSGFVWYRVRLTSLPKGKPLSLYVPEIRTSFQIFADGERLVGCGLDDIGMKPVLRSAPLVCDVPVGATDHSSVVLALRIWQWPLWASFVDGGPQGSIRVADRSLIHSDYTLHIQQLSWSFVDLIVLTSLQIGAAVISFFLFAFRRREREYFWFGILMLFWCANSAWLIFVNFHWFNFNSNDMAGIVSAMVESAAEILFYFYLLRLRSNWFFYVTVASVLLGPIVGALGVSGLLSMAVWNGLSILQILIKTIWILCMLAWRAWQGFPDARLLILPFAIGELESIARTVKWTFHVLHHDIQMSWLNWKLTWPFPWTADDLTALFFLLAMLTILLHRFYRTGVREERMALELTSAAEVQHVLIPETLPDIAGLSIESAYLPASEVGGDFFQVIPYPSGGALIAVGDVSGKGTPAALTVALIVGALRTLAESTEQPSEILSALNRRLLGRSGFTTCIVLRVQVDGECVVANAGHLPPYIDGEEMLLEANLPLGIAPDVTFDSKTFVLSENSRLTLVTDGVLEARSKRGVLFGFERLKTHSNASADELARKAKTFGQEDDITILSIVKKDAAEQWTRTSLA